MLKLFLAVLGATMALSVQSAYAAKGPEVIVAHRGVGSSVQVKYGIPENSIPAWGWAIDHAKRDFIVDMDAQITSDAQIVVMHDSTIDRTTNRTGRVHDRTLAYITAAYLELPVDRDGNGNDDNTTYHPPSLNQAVTFLQPKTFNGEPVKVEIEMKGGYWSRTQVGKLRDLLKSKSMLTTRVNVHSSSTTVLGYARDAGFPNIGYGVPSTGSPPTVATMQTYKATRVFLWQNMITQQVIDQYHDAEIEVMATTLNDQGDYDRMIQFDNIYGWVCDDLVAAQNYLEAAA